MALIKYVLGFLFDFDLSRVVLIKNNKPSWQAGRLNGVGGKIEPGESPYEAMTREFEEEAGINISEWDMFATLSGSDWRVFCFVATSNNLDDVSSMTDEKLKIGDVDLLRSFPALSNITWLVPLARDKVLNKGLEVATIYYK